MDAQHNVNAGEEGSQAPGGARPTLVRHKNAASGSSSRPGGPRAKSRRKRPDTAPAAVALAAVGGIVSYSFAGTVLRGAGHFQQGPLPTWEEILLFLVTLVVVPLLVARAAAWLLARLWRVN